MKNFLAKYTASLLLGAIISMVVVFSVTRAAPAATVLSTLETPTSPEDTSTIEQRLAARKTVFKVQLSAADKSSLIGKCVLSQSALTDTRAKDQKAATVRFQTYSDLAKKLSYLVDNLIAQGVDGSELLDSQNKFVDAINIYLKDAETYKTAMDDAINVDCKSDPTGFKVSLLEARQTRSSLGKDVASIKSNLTGLKKSLSDERQLLIKTPSVKPVVRAGVHQ
ncbi:hypothetical protein KW789_02280 [Candidatus Saccharibacteria bacterium]|nr:hypothetical protein [Candidatus Saccharibacteria bacterium]